MFVNVNIYNINDDTSTTVGRVLRLNINDSITTRHIIKRINQQYELINTITPIEDVIVTFNFLYDRD